MGKGKSNASQSIEDRKPTTISLSEWYKTEKSNVWQFIEYKGSKATYQSMGKLIVSSLSLRNLQSFDPIFSYLTVQDMYNIVHKNTSSKIEEVVDEVPNVGEIHEQNEHD